MDRAGKKATPLTHDELQAVFEAVSAGEDAEATRRRLPNRDRTTVNRAHKVVAAFEREGLNTLDDAKAEKIAQATGYSTITTYVHNLFARWRAWKPRSLPVESGADIPRDPHRMGLIYFGRRLRDRLRPDPPSAQGEFAEGDPHGMWQGAFTSYWDDEPQGAVEEGVERDWRFGRCDARAHPLFCSFAQHLEGHRTLQLLEAAERAIHTAWTGGDEAAAWQAIGEFQQSLRPDDLLEKLVLQGRCLYCS